MDKHQTLLAWMHTRKHMPSWMRDFHDQKDLFKALDDYYGLSEKAQNAEDIKNPKWMEDHHMKGYSWVLAHVYIVDFFLWFMALHGYTLQKTRKPIDTYDIEQTLKELKEKRMQKFFEMFDEEAKKRKEEREKTS